MDPVTLTALLAVGGAATGGGLAGLMDMLGGRERRYQNRELREIFGVRYGLGQSFLQPEGWFDIGSLGSMAQTQPFGPRAVGDMQRELTATQAGESIASEEAIRSNIAAQGLAPGDLASQIQAETSRARSLLANMAQTQGLSYMAQANVRGLEQARQAYAQALNERYGTLSMILGAGV